MFGMTFTWMNPMHSISDFIADFSEHNGALLDVTVVELLGGVVVTAFFFPETRSASM